MILTALVHLHGTIAFVLALAIFDMASSLLRVLCTEQTIKVCLGPSNKLKTFLASAPHSCGPW